MALDCKQELIEVIERETLIECEQEQLVVSDGAQVVLVTEGQQGPPGPPGAAGTAYISLQSVNALGGHRAVRLAASVLIYADNTDVAGANALLGLTLGAVGEGGTANIQTSGLLTEPSWNWTADQPVFVGANGVPVQPSPATGYSLVLGVATSPTQIFIGARTPIILQE